MAKAENTKQLGSRLDPSLADWIQSKSKELGIKQGEFVARMQQVYIENDITEKYPQWSAQIQDVHFWATSLVDAYVAQLNMAAGQMTTPGPICRRYWSGRTISLISS